MKTKFQQAKPRLLLLFSFVVTSLATSRFHQPGNITLGVILPAHSQTASGECGELYLLGLGYIEAISYAIERINNSTELLPGLSLGLDVRDYCYNPRLAMQWAYNIVANNDHNELVQRNGVLSDKFTNLTDPVVAVIGTIESGSTGHIAGLFQVVNISIVSPFSTSEELSSPYFTSFARTIPPDGEQSKAMADIIDHFNWSYVAAVAHDGSYGQHGVRALEREAYNRQTFCIAFVEFFTTSGYKGKVEEIVRKIKRQTSVKVIVFWSNYYQTHAFLSEATKQGLTDRTFLLSEAMATFGTQVIRRYSSVLGNSLAIMPHQFPDSEFEKHLKNLTPDKTRQGGNPWWEEYWASEAECVESGSKECNAQIVSESGFKKLYSAYVSYVTDSVYAVANGLDKWHKSQLELNITDAKIEPYELLKFMNNLTFRGITGTVHFKTSGDPANAYYDVMNFRRKDNNSEYYLENIGFWKKDSNSEPLLHVDDKAIQWKTTDSEVPISGCSKPCPTGTKQSSINRCCWECFQCPEGTISSKESSTSCKKCSKEQMSNKENTKCVDLPLQNIQWEDSTATVVLFLTAVGFLLTIIVFGVYLKQRLTPIVKGSNEELSYLLLFIISLSLFLPILHLFHPTPAVCYLLQPWRYLTCTACVSILFLKTNRLVNVFYTEPVPHWFKAYILGRKGQLVVVLSLNVIQFILSSLWLILDPPHVHKDITFQKHVFVFCMPYKSSTGLIIRAVMFGYFVFMSLLCILYAFKARKLPDNFNEARYIGFSLYVLLLSWITYYPVDSALEGFYITIVACATGLMIAFGVLGCMFFPKIFIMLVYPERNTLGSVKAEVTEFSLRISSAPNLIKVNRKAS
ncbi:predicted protein [Nematostella vectensis]|uniref:G-protein coupled receptors family 3 profile domain-containing protein n=1 Tax=Nematostella vectensis TaxID=45351 RepID=A7RSA2_NEMVE|nr:extracellular calcium-sensing receptor [Nematostella vectensis]EDO45773.1 predicted protein [Nematostella vectensis]|eukprot:XP_001637836.1 predicted protein [Nematostella vectensis]